MENYVMVKMEELEELCNQYKETFGVDLTDEKYRKIPGLEERWNEVLKDTFGVLEEKNWKEKLEENLYY